MESKMKVMQIIPNLGLGGAEVMVENLSISLVDKGIETCVVSLYNYESPITQRLNKKNIPIYFINKKNGLDLKVILSLYRLFKKEKPDVIHTHLYALQYAVIAAILSRVPVKVHTIHSVAEKEAGKLKRKIYKVFYKYFGVKPVTISPLVKETVLNEYKLPKTKVEMVYNGIIFKGNNCKVVSTNEEKSVNIVHIGNFKKAKNHIQLIESFKIVNNTRPDTVLKLIGSGDLEGDIKGKVKELNLEKNVLFLGAQSNVYPYLEQADIFILPSIWEGMPITLIEAMSVGLPIIATRVGGIPDMIINNDSGLLVDPDTENIAEALLTLINDRNLREKLGASARNSSKRFSAKEMTDSYIKIYIKSLDRKIIE